MDAQTKEQVVTWMPAIVAALAAVLAWLAKSRTDKANQSHAEKMQRENQEHAVKMEALRRESQVSAEAAKFSFTTLHKERADAIKAIHEALLEYNEEAMMYVLRGDSEKTSRFREKSDTLSNRIDGCSIYFDRLLTEQLHACMRDVEWHNVMSQRMDIIRQSRNTGPEANRKYDELFSKTREFATVGLKQAEEALREKFRQLLGVGPEA